jgi:hypothetical protein
VHLINVRFPSIADLGIYNRRHIAGTNTWSQHAWGNAIDLTSPRWYGPRVSWNPMHMAYMDNVCTWLQANRLELGIDRILWRTTNHYDHNHTQFTPRQTGTPPVITGPDPGAEVIYKHGDRGDHIAAYQRNLIEIGALEEGQDDGIYGTITEAAVVKFQGRPNVKLDKNGTLDDPTRDQLAIAVAAERLRVHRNQGSHGGGEEYVLQADFEAHEANPDAHHE